MIPVGSNGRLALFLPTLDDGGAERVMLQLAASFCARGSAVDLLVAVPGGPLEAQVPPEPRVVSLSASRTILALPKTKQKQLITERRKLLAARSPR